MRERVFCCTRRRSTICEVMRRWRRLVMDRVGLMVLRQVGTSIRQRRWPSHAPRRWRHAVSCRLGTVMVAKRMAVLQRRRRRRNA